MAMTAAQLNVIFGSQGADKVKRDLGDVGESVTRAGSGFDRLKAGALGLGTALIVPMGLGLRAAVDLEQGIANINASLGGLDPGTLDELAASFQEIGAASQYSATEVAAVADELAKAGYGAEDLLNGMTQAVVDLSQATGDGLGPATEGIITAMSIWKDGVVDASIAMTDASRVADILTIAANESSAGLTDIQAGMRSLGPVAAMMGISYEEAAASIALFTNNGLKGADAGISLARGLQNLADPTSEATELMNELGISAFDAQGNFVGFPELFRQLQTGMSGLDQQTQLLALSTIFGAEAMDVMGLAILNGADPLEALIGLMDESGAAAEQSALRMDTLGAQFGELTEGVSTLLGTLVQGLIPGLRWLIDSANAVVDVLMKIPKPIKTIVGAIAGGLAAFAALNMAMKGFALFNELAGGSGVGLSLRGMLPILGGIAAGAGALYLAWRTNFLGIRDILTDLAKRATDTFTDIGDVLVHFGRVWRGAFGAFRNNGDNLLASGLRAMGVGLEQVSRFSPRFGTALRTVSQWTMQAADNVMDLTYNFRQFRDAGVNVVAASLMSLGAVFPRFENVLRPVTEEVMRFFGSFALGRTLIDATGGTWFESIVGGLQVALSNLRGTAVRFGGWVLDVAVPTVTGWIVDAASNVWDALKTAAGWVWDGLASIGAWTLETAIPTVTGWIVDAAGDVWSALKTAAGWTWDQVVDLGNVVVDIAGWVVQSAQNLWDRVKAFVKGGSGGFGESQGMGGAQTSYAREPIHIGNIPISIGGFDFTIDGPGLWDAFNDWFDRETTITPDMIANAEAKGRDIGQRTWESIKSGIRSIFGGGGAAQFDEDGGASGVTGMSDIVTGFLGNFFQGLGQAILTDLDTWIDGIKTDIQDKWNTFWDNILPDVSIDMPDIDWPDLPSPPDWLTSPPAWLSALASGDIMAAVEALGGGGSVQGGGGGTNIGTAPAGGTGANGGPRQFMSGGGEKGWANAASNLRDIAGAASEAGASMGLLAANAAPALTALDGIGPKASSAGMGVTTFGSSAMTAGSALRTGIVASLQASEAGFASFAASASGSMGALVGAVSSGMGAMTGAVVGGMGAIAGAAAGGMAAVVGSVAGGMAAATGAVAANAGMWPGIVAGYAGAMAGAGAAVGRAAGMGVASGMLSTLGAVQAAAAQIVATVNGAMRAAARIASPSRMTAEIGAMLTEGVAAGLADATALRHVTASASGVMGTVSSAMVTNPYRATGAGFTPGHSSTFAPSINVNVTAGNGMDEQALAERVADEVYAGLEIANARYTRSLGVSR